MRILHLGLGLVFGLFLTILAATGVVLAVDAFGETTARAPPPPAGMTVAELAAGLERHGGLAELRITPAGTIVARFEGEHGRVAVDPTTFAVAPAPPPSTVVRLATEVHRTLSAGEAGRILLAVATFGALVSALSGIALSLRRERGSTGAHRLHRLLGLALALPLVVLATTGLGLAVAALRPLDVHGVAAPFPAGRVEGPRLPIGEVAALRAVAVGDLETLVPSRPDDPEDTHRLTTVDRFAHVDPVTGLLAVARDRPAAHRVAAMAMRLHSGRLSPVLAVVLGLAAAAAPLLVVSGVPLAVGARRARRRFASGRDVATADTIVLVGSEGGTTRAFADRLVATLADHGHAVHLAAMNDLAPAYPRAARLLVLTATHGVGTAPRSADRFLDRLANHGPLPPFAVVGFGERGSARFCGYAEDVDAALAARGGTRLLPLHRIHRRSEAEFAAWLDALLAVLGHDRAAPAGPGPTALAAPAVHAPLVRRVLSGPAMGSRWTVTLHAPEQRDLGALTADLAARVEDVEAALSRFREGSEILRLEAAPLGRWLPLSEDAAQVLAVGLDVGRRSGGAFDLGLAAEVAAAGFGRGWALAPGTETPRRPAHEAIELDLVRRRLRKHAPIRLDLAGIAKGHAVDVLARRLREAGLPSHLVALDGELTAGAAQPDGRAWSIGLEAPAYGLRTTLGRLPLVHRAVATSGDYRRFGRLGGHTLDPATGRPATAGPASVTALAATCIEADAWATALMVRGRAGLAAACAAGIDAIFVDRDDHSPREAEASRPRSNSPDGREGRWREAHP